MSRLLRRATWRELRRHPLQTALAVGGVALGVAVVVAVDQANASAARAFDLATATLAGRSTHSIVGGPGGVPEEVYQQLRVQQGLERVAPVIERVVQLSVDPPLAFTLLGIDPLAEAGMGRPVAYGGPAGLDLATFLTVPGAALLTATAADRLHLEAGDSIPLRVDGRRVDLLLAGRLEPGDDPTALAGLSATVVVDVATAQESLAAPGRLTRIDLALDETDVPGVAALLPPPLRLVSAARGLRQTRQMTRAFSLNLVALSLLALLCGVFVVANAMSFSVVRRRWHFALLRISGVSGRRLFWAVLWEAAIVGLVGTGLGLVAGIALARGLVAQVTQTINDLYYVLEVRDVAVSAASLVKGALLGLCGAIVAALPPAREVAFAGVAEALRPAGLERRAGARLRSGVIAGLSALAAAALLLIPQSLTSSFVGVFVGLLGWALLIPALTSAALRLGAFAVRGGSVAARLAWRDAERTLSRTGVAVAALAVALAVSLGVGLMIDSFRRSVTSWLDGVLQADVYLSSQSTAGTGAFPAALIDALAALPGVAAVNTIRQLEVRGEDGPVRLLGLAPQRLERGAFPLLAGGAANRVWEAWHGGAVLISEPFASHHRLRPGDRLPLPGDRDLVELEIAGVYRDYGSDRGVVLIERRRLDALWEAPGSDGVAVFAARGANVERLLDRIGQLSAPFGVVPRSNRALKEASLAVFERTFAITSVLRSLAGAVAFFGIVAALLSLAVERRRELAILRVVGLSPGRLRRLVLLQTALLGLLAGLLALPAGTALAAVMVQLINRRAFGWTMELQLPLGSYAAALATAVVAAVLAGLYPAAAMARQSLPSALRDE